MGIFFISFCTMRQMLILLHFRVEGMTTTKQQFRQEMKPLKNPVNCIWLQWLQAETLKDRNPKPSSIKILRVNPTN